MSNVVVKRFYGVLFDDADIDDIDPHSTGPGIVGNDREVGFHEENTNHDDVFWFGACDWSEQNTGGAPGEFPEDLKAKVDEAWAALPEKVRELGEPDIIVWAGLF